MIITLTGAYRNIGDHLIGERAKQLLCTFCDSEIININRSTLSNANYSEINKAKAIFLCGGPAYQKEIFPSIYNLDFNQLNTTVIPFGLGWKGETNQSPLNFDFSPYSQEQLIKIHQGIKSSSVRDYKTKELLNSKGITNVTMTGCPAWYNLDYIDKSPEKLKESSINTIIFSLPALVDSKSISLMRYLSQRFPRAKKICAFHHGFYTDLRVKSQIKTIGFLRAAFFAKSFGFEIADLNSELEKFSIYDHADLHIGYRVHAHIYMLSQRKNSIIIAEDSRAVGQAETLKQDILNSKSTNLNEEVDQQITKLLKDSSYIEQPIEVMKQHFPIMKNFLTEL